MSLMKPFSKVAAALGLGLLVSGCSTINVQGGPCTEGGGGTILGTGGYSMRYNDTCGVRQAAGQMLQADDAGVKAAGVIALEETSPTLREAGNKVRDALVNDGMTQSFEVVVGPDGKTRLVGQPLIRVPVRERQASATPASAPAPAPQP